LRKIAPAFARFLTHACILFPKTRAAKNNPYSLPFPRKLAPRKNNPRACRFFQKGQ